MKSGKGIQWYGRERLTCKELLKAIAPEYQEKYGFMEHSLPPPGLDIFPSIDNFYNGCTKVSGTTFVTPFKLTEYHEEAHKGYTKCDRPDKCDMLMPNGMYIKSNVPGQPIFTSAQEPVVPLYGQEVKNIFPFTKLPREMRDRIYKLSLITDIEIVMYPQAYEMDDLPDFGKDEKPLVALLAVDKQMRLETADIFYMKNTFRLPMTSANRDHFRNYEPLLHNVVLRLDSRMVSEAEKHAIAVTEHNKPDTDFAAARPTAARWRHIHKLHIELFAAKWTDQRDFILELKSIKNLTFDMKFFYCPGLCCRIDIFRHDLYAALGKYMNPLDGYHGNKVKAAGLTTENEKAVLQNGKRWAKVAEEA